MALGPFDYIGRSTPLLGVGVSNRAPVMQDVEGPFMIPAAYHTTRQLATMTPNTVYSAQAIRTSDLIQNGMAISGMIALQALVELS